MAILLLMLMLLLVVLAAMRGVQRREKVRVFVFLVVVSSGP